MGAAGALSGTSTRRRALLAVGAALGGCALPPAEAPALDAAVEALVQPLVQARKFSGAVVLMRDGRLQVARGWGLANHELGLAFTPATPCDAASLAKNFTAAGLWLLVHEGRLQLSQPVRTLVPEYPHEGVTVAHLIDHSGGLAPDYGSFDRHFRPGELRTAQALLRLAGRDAPEPAFAPGSRVEYSDLGYDALALVIERISGQGYAEFVRRRFFEPLGLVDAFARPARFRDWPRPRTRGYRFADGRWQDDDAYDGEAFLGASNLIFSAQDLARWGDAWVRGRVLPAAAEHAGSAVPQPGGRRSAIDRLGWYGADERGAGAREGHNTGHYNGFRACVHWDRSHRAVAAYVSNSALPQAAGEALQRALMGLLTGRAASRPLSLVPGTEAWPGLGHATARESAGRPLSRLDLDASAGNRRGGA